MECIQLCKKKQSFGAALINVGDIILSEIRQAEIDIQCLKYTGAKKVDLIEAENTLERKHWFKTKFSAQRRFICLRDKGQTIRDKDRR